MTEENKSTESLPVEEEQDVVSEESLDEEIPDSFDEEDDSELEELVKAAQEAIRSRTGKPPEDEPSGEAVPDGAANELVAQINDLEQDLKRKEDEAQDFRDRLLRLHAEFDNFKKRSRREKSDIIRHASEELIRELLPVLDNFERALEMSKQANVDENFVKGFDLIYSQSFGVLGKRGLQIIEAVGQPFDPNLHEAVMREESDQYPENTVAQEFRRGYSLQDKVIRQSMVSVATAVVEEKDPPEEPGEEEPIAEVTEQLENDESMQFSENSPKMVDEADETGPPENPTESVTDSEEQESDAPEVEEGRTRLNSEGQHE